MVPRAWRPVHKSRAPTTRHPEFQLRESGRSSSESPPKVTVLLSYLLLSRLTRPRGRSVRQLVVPVFSSRALEAGESPSTHGRPVHRYSSDVQCWPLAFPLPDPSSGTQN